MVASIFQEFLNQVWPKLTLYVSEKENGSHRVRTYLHKQRLTALYSADQKWTSTTANNRYVAADMVSLDSPLPIKARGSISQSNGEIPKIGIGFKLSESDINTINIMKAQLSTLPEGSEAYKAKKMQIIAKLANDGEKCSIGIDERNEYNYLYGISNGVVLVPDENASNTGLGLRLNYGYLKANTFKTQVAGEVDMDDIANVITHADANGVTPAIAMISKSLLTNIRKCRWARQLAADYKEQVYSAESLLPVPSEKTFKEAFQSEYGFELMVIDRTVTIQKNGKDVHLKPFNQNRIIFLPDATNDGSLVWSELAESGSPVEGVNYTTLDSYKLISRYRVTTPAFAEFTKGQALVIPVIDNVDSIYILDCSSSVELAATDATDAGSIDNKITINGKNYQKSAVVIALNNLGVVVKESAKDATVIKKINELSDEETDAFMKAIASSVIA